MKSVHTWIHFMLSILMVPGISNGQATNINKNIKNKESKMSTTQRNKDVIRKLYDQSLNKRNMELLQNIISADYVGAQGKKGAAGFEEPIAPLIKAFPDIQWNVEDIIGEGDRVVVRWKLRGTHTGQYQNFTTTGKTITNDGMAIFEFNDGKIINVQLQTDRLGFLQELEVLPHDLTLLSNKKLHEDKVNFIDKFFVPSTAKKEFYERMSFNREFIRKLPGFIGDAAYEYTDSNGNLICVTIAQWENREAINKAKEAVQAEYKKQGFDMVEMLKRLNIVTDRGIYTDMVGIKATAK